MGDTRRYRHSRSNFTVRDGHRPENAYSEPESLAMTATTSNVALLETR
jgi:hypothetical protein